MSGHLPNILIHKCNKAIKHGEDDFLDYDWPETGRRFQLAMTRDAIPPIVSHFYGFFYLLPLGHFRGIYVDEGVGFVHEVLQRR